MKKDSIQLIPAIDIIQGQCVRLSKGDYDTKRVYGNPVEIAQQMEALGFRRLHLVDLDGAKEGHVVNLQVLRDICQKTNLIIDFGGGVKTEKDVELVLETGAKMITVGSMAVKSPSTLLKWIETYGAEHLILGSDVRNGRISINGWMEDSEILLDDFLQYYTEAGIKNVLCTDISRDGMLQGPSTPLYRKIMEAHPQCHLIASGGVSCIEDIIELDEAGIPAVVFGKAIYEGRINLQELAKKFLLRHS
ncbi:MAG: 1-(5-phosphoribosyl)-5-[Bacteroidaceae bacterium]|nr:1-(5-phosphoribosyl)-5-[(5-phosphoribosylamino)methylideneamino]imidazole-4-carboxamide isomerase [Bacteroidaceae bacterium]